MELTQLIEELGQPRAYRARVEAVEVRQTHISVVFLAGAYAYKIKKPVNLGFLDFSALQKRRHFCHEEVRLNRRLAPSVYLGVVPVSRDDTGVRMEGEGEAIEWAVKMERLPDQSTLRALLECQKVRADFIPDLARRIAAFHALAERGKHVASYGRFEVVAGNARENFDQSESQVGAAVSRSAFDRLRFLTEEALDRHRGLIDLRADRGLPCDTHGDLRLDHIYLLPGRAPPDDLAIIDCIEFNERFRFADPVADIAFLVMDLLFHGHKDVARTLAEEYFRAAGDDEGRELLPFYVAYRSAVRGKVRGFESREKEVRESERGAALARARGHWLMALAELETPARRPCLLLIGGLPGTGKSTLARALSERAGFSLIRSDVVRKQLARLTPEESARSSYAEGIYTPEWTDRTYAECLAGAEQMLVEGKRVIIDASFGSDQKRRDFLELAERLRLARLFMICRTDMDTMRKRLSARRGDASDADGSIAPAAAERWEPVGPLTSQLAREVSTSGPPEHPLAQALQSLREAGLL